MISLIVNVVVAVLSFLNNFTFGLLDNQAVVYGVLVAAVMWLLIILEKRIKFVSSIAERGSRLDKFLVIIGLVLNALPNWGSWLLGIAIIGYVLWTLKAFEPEAEKAGLVKRLKKAARKWAAEEDET